MDSETRTHERSAAAGDPEAKARLLRERLRAGEVTREWVLFRAVMGDAQARKIVSPYHLRLRYVRSWEDVDAHQPFASWTQGLNRWAEERAAPCPESRGLGWCAPTSSGEHACTVCNGTGRVTKPIPVTTHAAVAAARAAQVATCFENNPTCTRTRCTPILKAIEAAEAWIACPCEEHRRACAAGAGIPFWAPSRIMLSPAHKGLAARKIQAAARVIGEPAVRAAIRERLWRLARVVSSKEEG